MTLEDAAVVEVGTKLDNNQPTMSPSKLTGTQKDKKGSAVDSWQTLPLAGLWLSAQAFILHAVAKQKKSPYYTGNDRFLCLGAHE